MSVHIAFETPKDVQDNVYELVKLVGSGNGRLKKGSNEVTKAAERGTAKMIVMAENVNPAELLAHIPLICQEKSIPFIYVEDQTYLAEAASTGATGAGNVAALNKVILPVIRRVMPTVIANEIVGVQPMTGPVGQIHTLRVRYADSSDGNEVGEEALSPFKIAAAYSGNATDATPKGSATAALEGQAGKRLSIQILKQTVEAKTRKLSARWTFEAAQDAQAQQGIDIEAEIMAALAQEITAEIDQEIIASLTSLAGAAADTYAQGSVSGTATFVGDEHAALAVLINKNANTIAARTRRGAGNWAVVSPTVLTVLQSATTSAFARSTEGAFEAPTNTKFVGTLNGTMRIYVNTYASDATPVPVSYTHLTLPTKRIV